MLLFEKEALKSSDMKGKSSLREEGHGVRGEIKGAIFPLRREGSPVASPNVGEGLWGWAEGVTLETRAGGGLWAPGSLCSHTDTFQMSENGADAKK